MTPTPNTQRAALFDMDGTLVDTERVWSEAMSLMLEEEGVRYASENCLALSYGLAWPDVYAKVARRWPDAFSSLSIDRASQRLCAHFAKICSYALPVIEGSVALLRRLHSEGFAIGVVSGSPRRDVLRILHELHVDQLVSVVVASDDVTQGKPSPQGYLKACTALGVSPATSMAFEDSFVGVQAAKAAGLTVIAYANPTAPAQTLDAADQILTDLSDYVSK